VNIHNVVKQSLESSCFNTKAAINDVNLAYKIDRNEKEMIKEYIEKIQKWMKRNQEVRFY
jgi:molecular chaperone DnaK (HSP70)